MIQVAFWQRIVSPHMGSLACALARRGHDVTYVAEHPISPDRLAMGWSPPDIAPARILYAPHGQEMRAILQGMPAETVHLTQGLRANGAVRAVQKVLAKQGARHWALMETVEDLGIRGAAKRIIYRHLLREFLKTGEGILGIGERMPAWLGALGVPPARSIPFAYFLAEPGATKIPEQDDERIFRIVFVGQLIARKRVQDILFALARHEATWPFRLTIVGDGPEGTALRILGERLLHDRIDWLGALPIGAIPRILAHSDLLVLPSRHDGWGAVVSEALLQGTPAACSDRCGAAGVVRASKVGGVFPMGDVDSLATRLLAALREGRVTSERRAEIARRAEALGAARGAEYLEMVLHAAQNSRSMPRAPWLDIMEGTV